MTTLDARLLAAHAAGDEGALVRLYAEAAAAANDPQARAFYLTHAHVFALVLGLPEAEDLRARLIAEGREAPVPPARPPRR